VQKKASFISIGAYYIVTIPLGFVLVFVCGMGVKGLWTGILIGLILNSILYVRLVLKTDWQGVADEA